MTTNDEGRGAEKAPRDGEALLLGPIYRTFDVKDGGVIVVESTERQLTADEYEGLKRSALALARLFPKVTILTLDGPLDVRSMPDEERKSLIEALGGIAP